MKVRSLTYTLSPATSRLGPLSVSKFCAGAPNGAGVKLFSYIEIYIFGFIKTRPIDPTLWIQRLGSKCGILATCHFDCGTRATVDQAVVNWTLDRRATRAYIQEVGTGIGGSRQNRLSH